MPKHQPNQNKPNPTPDTKNLGPEVKASDNPHPKTTNKPDQETGTIPANIAEDMHRSAVEADEAPESWSEKQAREAKEAEYELWRKGQTDKPEEVKATSPSDRVSAEDAAKATKLDEDDEDDKHKP